MKIFFSTLVPFADLSERNLYADLVRELVSRGHHLTVANASGAGAETRLEDRGSYRILHFPTHGGQKSGRLSKLRSLLSYDDDLRGAIRKCLPGERLDLALVATPPITLVKTFDLLGQMGAFRYLMLKDIFPQNAVDIGLMRRGGILHRYYRRMERRLYTRCEAIGCMSEANVAYVRAHNPKVPAAKVHLLPNAIEPVALDTGTESDTPEAYTAERPLTVMYGGNLGKPQGIPFLIDLIRHLADEPRVRFVIIGSGTEYGSLEAFAKTHEPPNLELKSALPKAAYDAQLAHADIGLILLDARFTIPNYPSRLLSYLEYAKPVLCLTDDSSDVGTDAVRRGYGFALSSAELGEAVGAIKALADLRPGTLDDMGRRGRAYLSANYHVAHSATLIETRLGAGRTPAEA